MTVSAMAATREPGGDGAGFPEHCRTPPPPGPGWDDGDGVSSAQCDESKADEAREGSSCSGDGKVDDQPLADPRSPGGSSLTDIPNYPTLASPTSPNIIKSDAPPNAKLIPVNPQPVTCASFLFRSVFSWSAKRPVTARPSRMGPLTCVRISSTSIQLAWTLPPTEEQALRVGIRGRKAKTMKGESNPWMNVDVKKKALVPLGEGKAPSAASGGVTVDGLQPGVVYEFLCCAKNEQGWGPFGPPSRFRMVSTPNTPVRLTPVMVMANAFELGFLLPAPLVDTVDELSAVPLEVAMQQCATHIDIECRPAHGGTPWFHVDPNTRTLHPPSNPKHPVRSPIPVTVSHSTDDDHTTTTVLAPDEGSVAGSGDGKDGGGTPDKGSSDGNPLTRAVASTSSAASSSGSSGGGERVKESCGNPGNTSRSSGSTIKERMIGIETDDDTEPPEATVDASKLGEEFPVPPPHETILDLRRRVTEPAKDDDLLQRKLSKHLKHAPQPEGDDKEKEKEKKKKDKKKKKKEVSAGDPVLTVHTSADSPVTTTMTFAVKGLEEGTPYEVRVSCKNDAGWSAPSDPIVVTTRRRPSKILGVRCIDPTSHSITICWDPIPLRAERISNVGIKIKGDHEKEWRHVDAKRHILVPLGKGKAPSAAKGKVTVVGLDPSSSYQLMVCAGSAYGWGPYSDPIHFHTTVHHIRMAPLGVSSISETSFELEWNIPACEVTAPGKASEPWNPPSSSSHVDIQCRREGDVEWMGLHASSGTLVPASKSQAAYADQGTVTVEGLERGALYEVVARTAIADKGDDEPRDGSPVPVRYGPPSSPIFVQTSAGPMSPLTSPDGIRSLSTRDVISPSSLVISSPLSPFPFGGSASPQDGGKKFLIDSPAKVRSPIDFTPLHTPLSPSLPIRFPSLPKCPYFQRCRRALIKLLKEGTMEKDATTNTTLASGGDDEEDDGEGLEEDMDYDAHPLLTHLNDEASKCFCHECHASRGDGSAYKRAASATSPGSLYILPVGWSRIGVHPGKMPGLARRAFKEWHVAYHGTEPAYVQDILFSGQLLKPGSTTYKGHKIPVRTGHIQKGFYRTNIYSDQREFFDPTEKVFFSPSIKYCDYGKAYMTEYLYKGNHYRFAMQVRIQPGTYSIGQETVGARSKNAVIDPLVPNSAIEWYTNEVHTHMITGIMVAER